MGAGRPSEYKESYCDDVNAYLSAYESRGQTIPTREGFCEFIGSTKPTILRWAEAHDEFRYALEKIDTQQALRLQNKGLLGEYNPTITKLILSANHDMKEKSDFTSDNKAIPPLLVKFLDGKDNGDTQGV